MSWHQMASQEHPTVSSVLCFPGIAGTVCQLFFFLHVIVSLFYPSPSSEHVNFLSQPLHTLKKAGHFSIFYFSFVMSGNI